MNTKSLLIAVLGLFSILSISAENKFFIEDFSIEAGETKEIEICLTNDEAFTGFQADIYLPEGLSFYQEDGEYIFDLSSRKHRSHTISSALQTDGAVRLLSYSTTSKEYSDSEGVLVYCSIVASEDFSGSHEIRFANTKFAKSDGTEILFDPSTTIVTGPTSGNEESNEVFVTIKDAVNGQISVAFEKGKVAKFKFEASTEWLVNTVLFNGTDVTSQLDENGIYLTPELTENAIINVSYIDFITSVNSITYNNIKIYGNQGVITVIGATLGDTISVYDLNGKTIHAQRSAGSVDNISLNNNKTYIVKVGNTTHKVIL